jgi:hypothetical protein
MLRFLRELAYDCLVAGAFRVGCLVGALHTFFRSP